MFFWYSLTFSMIQQMLAIWTLVPLPFLFFFFNFYFYFILLYNTVLVLPYIDMNPPRVYMCSQTWAPLPPPSPLTSLWVIWHRWLAFNFYQPGCSRSVSVGQHHTLYGQWAKKGLTFSKNCCGKRRKRDKSCMWLKISSIYYLALHQKSVLASALGSEWCIGTNQELMRKVEPQTLDSQNRNLRFNKIPRWFRHTLKLKRHKGKC